MWCSLNSNAHPSLLSWWRKKSFAASLMAFSGVTRVRFTAAPAATNTDNDQHVSGSDFNLMSNRLNGELTATVGGRRGRDLSLTSVHAKVAFIFNRLYEAVHPKKKHWCQKKAVYKIKWQTWKKLDGIWHHCNTAWLFIVHLLFSLMVETHFGHLHSLGFSSVSD